MHSEVFLLNKQIKFVVVNTYDNIKTVFMCKIQKMKQSLPTDPRFRPRNNDCKHFMYRQRRTNYLKKTGSILDVSDYGELEYYIMCKKTDHYKLNVIVIYTAKRCHYEYRREQRT
jgi:hypothetical protein